VNGATWRCWLGFHRFVSQLWNVQSVHGLVGQKWYRVCLDCGHKKGET
jgi:hypothetical protein